MALGTLHYVRVCAADGTLYDSVCTATAGKMKMVEAYILDPAAAAYLDPLGDPFDYTMAAGFWGLAFTSVLALYLVSHAVGTILNIVKRR